MSFAMESTEQEKTYLVNRTGASNVLEPTNMEQANSTQSQSYPVIEFEESRGY